MNPFEPTRDAESMRVAKSSQAVYTSSAASIDFSLSANYLEPP